MTNFDTVREALAAIADTHVHTYKQALTALAEIERQHYTPEDMADAQAKAFRAGVASVTAGQEVVAWLYNRTGSELNPWLMKAGQEAEDLRVGRGEIMKPSDDHVDWTPLYAAPVAQQTQAEAAPMSQPNRLIAYSAAAKLRELGYQWDEEAEAWAPQQAEAVPPGYVLVPVEPTDEMLKAAAKACDGRMYPADMRHGPRAQNADRYRAMIAAAPLPVEDHLKLHAVEELCQLGYTVKDGELFPPDHLHKLMEAAGHPLSVRKGGTA